MEETVRTWLFEPTVWKLVSATVALTVIIIGARILRRSISRYVAGSDTRYRLRKFITFVSYVIAVLILTVIFSDRLGGLTVAMGVAGAGIAFALQEVVASFAGWFAVNFAGFYKPGDRVQLGGIKGDVIDISFLRTTLMEIGEWVGADLYTGRVVRVANSFVFKEPVFNYSGEFPFLWDEVTIPVRHGSDHRLARDILEKVAAETVGTQIQMSLRAWNDFSREFLLEDAATEPMVFMTANDNWIEFTVRYIVEFKKRRTTKDRFFTNVLDSFAETEGRVAYASTTLQLVDLPTLDIRLGTGKPAPEKATV